MKNEQQFYSKLEEVFIGEAGKKIEGKSGYVNLMKLKSQYFAHIKPFIEKEVNVQFGRMQEAKAREEAFQKLYTFFESYLNETGTPFFSQTPFHKNLYEKVYSEREDVSLFWKTQRLYYVKSEANYHSLQNLQIEDLTFDFDASQIEHQKNNEKKTFEFWATQLSENKITLKVIYQNGSRSKWDRLKELLQLDKPDEIRKYLVANFGNIENANIIYKDNGLSRSGLKQKQLENALLIYDNGDLTKSVTVEFALNNLDDLNDWAKQNQPALYNRTDTIKKAQQLYKKQNEVDYFIHKDAEGFLKEQFDIFLFQYLVGDNALDNNWMDSPEKITNLQKLKRIAHKIITYIARFEDELKHIWEKKKIVKQVNYVFTFDRLFPADKDGNRDFAYKNAIALVEKIINDKGFDKQIEEYRLLNQQWTNEKVEVKKIEWKEFAKAASLDKQDIIK
jgi:adenine-specific DNA-methyltransferase